MDHRADIYALGVVFYQMLTGELPGKPIEPPSSKVQIDVRLDEVVLRALEQKPELRYQQASVLKTQIETVASTPAGGAAAAATPPNAKPSGPRRLKKREIPVVGVRAGQRVIHWPGVAFRILVPLAVSAPVVYAVNGAAGVDQFLPVFFVVISIWLGIKCLIDWAQPIEKLPCLDEPSIDGPSATPPSETATASGEPWVSFCVTLTYLGTGLFGFPPSWFGFPPSLFHNHLLNQWSVGIFVELICLTSLLALLLNQLATPQAWRKWFKLAAWLGMVAWLLAIGSALFTLHIIYGLDQEATLVLLDQWSVGIFIKLICLTSLLALLLNQLATPQAWRKWSKLAAWLGMVAWLLAIGSALFALCLRYGLDQRATLDDTIFLSFIWLGAIALPICIVRLWRAANKPVKWSGASVPPAEPARKNSTGKSIATGCGVLAAGWLVFLLLVAAAGMVAALWFSGTKVAPTFGPVIERQVNKPVSDFPETTDLSTPESACAAWQRATARKDAQAVSRLSWVKLDPAEEEAWFRNEEARDPEGLTIYLKALAESRIVEVQTWRGDLADVITFLPFPPGKGRHPYSARSFGRIGGQWKNLGEDRLPSLEAARANFEQKKAAIWEQLGEFRPASGAALPIAVRLDKDDRDPFIVRGRVVDEQGNGLSDVIITACCGMGTLATTGEAHSRADGSYELRFHPGSVGLQAATIVPSKPGYFDANLQRQGELFMVDDLAALTKDSKRWGKVDTNKVVLPHRPYQLNFVLLPAAQIRGRFLDESNKPLAKKNICLSGEELPPSSSAYTSATTDDNGYFHFSNVPTTGKWWVGARLRDKFHDVRSEEFSLPIPGTYEFEMEWNSTNAASGLKIHYRLAQTTGAEAAAPANGHGTTQVSPAVSSAAQNLSGPAITRLAVSAGKAVMEGQGSTNR